MNSVASPPVFPLEIFGCIISHLVQDPSVLRYRPEKLNAVKQCSVVSKDFASLCQPYVFRVIDFVGFHGREELRLKKFVQTLTQNPNLSRYIRDLSLTFSESERCMLSRAEISKAIDVLLGLPNLQKLYISHSSCDDQRRFRLLRRIRAFLDDMINTYTSGGTLKFLGLNAVDNVSVSDILYCPTLKDIRLGRMPLPSITAPAPNITIFTVHSVPTVDLAILSYLPNLKKLGIRAVDSLIPPSANCGAPSLQLKSLDLRLHSPGDVSALVEFYTRFARLQDTQAFKNIEELEYESPFEEDIEALEIILNESKPLKELQFDMTNATSYIPPQYIFPLKRLCLPTKIPKMNMFSGLLDLGFALRVGEYPDAYNEALSEIISIITALSHRNAIEEVVIILETEFVGTTLPPPEPWSQLGALLASTAGFPRLKKVEAAVFLEVDEEDFWMMTVQNPSALSESELGEFMLRAMPELVERDEVEFAGELYIH